MADLRPPRVRREQNRARFAFAAHHRFTTEQLAWGFFPGGSFATRKKKASRWLVKMRKRGRVRVVGVVQRRDTGRPELVYGPWCRQDQLEHEIRRTDFFLLFIDALFVDDVKVGKTEA